MGLLKERIIRLVIGKSGDEAVESLGFAYVSIVREHPGLYEANNGHSGTFGSGHYSSKARKFCR